MLGSTPEVFWRTDDGCRSQLASTEAGWFVEFVRPDGLVTRRRRVTDSLHARIIAKTWRRETARVPDRQDADG
jgi:hypothetical protein